MEAASAGGEQAQAVVGAMTTALVTVSDDRSGRKGGLYAATQAQAAKLISDAPWLGIDMVRSWTWDRIVRTPWYEANRLMVDQVQPDMNGRAYKPFVIHSCLRELAPGDFLIYNDASPELWHGRTPDPKQHDLAVLKCLCASNGGVLTIQSRFIMPVTHRGDATHENFTLERCMERMGLSRYRHSLQHASTLVVLQKNARSVEFVEDWLRWNVIDECASLGPAGSGRHDYWVEEVPKHGKIGHRHDQSISGLLVNAMGLKLLKDISSYNFLDVCRRDRQYELIEGNLPPSKYRYRNVRGDDGVYRYEETLR